MLWLWHVGNWEDELRQQLAELLVTQGRALARRSEVDEAVAKFNLAQELNAELSLDAVKRANELA